MGKITMVIAIPTILLMYLYYEIQDFASPFETYLILHASLVGFVITICTLPFVNWTRVLGKLDTGLIPGSSYFIFWPYFLSLHAHVAVKRYFSTEPRFTEVRDGLFVGAWPSRPTDIPTGFLPAIVDCTCELPRMSCSMWSPYLCVRAWDSCAPTPSDIELAVRWAMLKCAEGVPVFIHCANGIIFPHHLEIRPLKSHIRNNSSFIMGFPAFSPLSGHGRSVTVLCALLVALGVSEIWQDAEVLVQSRCPKARLNKAQSESISMRRLQRIYMERETMMMQNPQN